MKNKLLAGLLISLLLCVNSYAQVKIERGLYIFQGGVRVSATNTNPPSPGIDFQVDGTNACDYLFVSKSITFTNGTSFNALNVADWNTATNFMDWLTTNTYVKSETDPVWSGVSNQYLFASIFTNWLDTNTYVKVELDPVWSGVSNQYLFDSIFTNWLFTNTYVKSETDPIWVGVSNLYLKSETDPVWSGVSNQYLFASIFTNWFGVLPVISSTSIVVDAGIQNIVLLTLTNDTTISAPINAVDGRKLEWRITANGSDRTVTWPTNIFTIPSSSTMTNVIVVSNTTTSIFLTERDVANNRWLMESYVWGY